MWESLPSKETSYSIRDFIHERNAINVRTVAKSFVRTCFLINEFIPEKSCINVGNGTKPFLKVPHLVNIREFTQGRDPTSVTNVVQPSFRAFAFLSIRDITLEKAV